MSFMMINKEFRLVGIKGRGEFANFGKEVPSLAQLLLKRASEISYAMETEIALYEPKKDENHRVGHYVVGLMVSETLNEVPSGMNYMELNSSYITTRGNISEVGELHSNLLNWGIEQGYHRDLDSFIIETYHPTENGEEVQVYLPVHT